MSADAEDQIVTLASPFEHEIDKIKNSRFLAYGAPASSFAEAKALLEHTHREHPDARHHCYAFRGLGDEQRSSDAGEPRGSAGIPILKVIDGRGLAQVMVVVVRYFGGTKLGVGGLVRAYGGAAAEMLDLAPKHSVPVMARLGVRFGADSYGVVSRTLATHGVRMPAPDYGETLSVQFEVPRAQLETLRQALRDASSGQTQCFSPDEP